MNYSKVDLTNLNYLRGSKMNVAIRMAYNKAMVPVKNALISDAPQGETGLLKKSFRIKVKYYTKSKTWVGICGPSKSVKKVIKRKKRKTKKVSHKQKRTSKLRKRATKIAKRTAKFIGKLSVSKAIKKRIKKLISPKPLVKRASRYAHLAGPGRKQRFLKSAYSKSVYQFKQIVITELSNSIQQICSRK